MDEEGDLGGKAVPRQATCELDSYGCHYPVLVQVQRRQIQEANATALSQRLGVWGSREVTGIHSLEEGQRSWTSLMANDRRVCLLQERTDDRVHPQSTSSL